MKKNYIARRRGTSVAAAALSFALVAPFAQPVVAPGSASAAFASTKDEAGQAMNYPGENAEGVYQSVVDVPRYTFSDQPIKVDGAEESKGVKNDKQSIEGYVIHQRSGDLSVYPGTDDPYRPIPMEGVRVYAQWTEKGGVTSPVYTTTTGPDGYYSIKMKSFNNAKGEVVKFDADPNAPQREKIRVWVDNPDTDNFTQLYGYNFGNMGPNGNTFDTPGGMGWGVGPDRVSNVRFAFGEKIRHDVMHRDDAVENPVDRQDLGSIKGRLFWHLHHTQGAFTPSLMNLPNGADVPAAGMEVYGSYLSDYAVAQIKDKAANDLGVAKVRGRGWTNRDEAALQNWIKRKMAEEGKDKWIAETAKAVVGSDGHYQLQFKGTFGRGRTNGDVDRGYDDKALVYTDLARDNGAEVIFPDGSKHNAYSLFGQVAPSSDYGSWVKNVSGRGGKNLPKHVNWDWLFFSTEETEGLGQFTPFYNNSFLPRDQYTLDAAGKWAGGIVYGAGENYLLENRHIVYSDYTVFDVLKYDTRQNPAKPGAKVDTKTGGLPTQWVDGRQYQIEWVNQETGKVVKTCDAMAADPNGSIPSCQLDTGDEKLFPGGIESTTTFTAILYPLNKETGKRGQAIAADAFTVLVGWQPLYEETKTDKVEEPVTSKAPTFDNTDTKDVEKLSADELKAQDANKEVTKYEVAEGFELPEGYAKPEVDPTTGEVTVTFPKDAASGARLEVPVKATFKDGTSATATAPFLLETVRDADGVEPEYEDKLVTPDEPAKSMPEFKKEDNGTPTDEVVDAPVGSTFEIPKDFEAPEGYTVEPVDPATGEVTVTVDKDKLNKDTVEEFEVPVEVTYPDGSKDDATAKFELDTDGDGAPDSKDDDDDGDGISDQEEKAKGSNPKNKGSIPATPLVPGTKNPDWDNSSTTPDKPVVIEKDPNSGDVPEGSTVEVTDGPGTAELDEDGNIKVTPSEDAKPGDKIVVEVKDPEGNVIDTVEVEIKEPEAPAVTDAEKFVPEYKDVTGVKVGENGNTENPFTEKDVPVASTEIKEINGEDPETAATDWEFEAQPDGVVKATAPTSDEVKKAVDEELPNLAEVEEKKRWDKFVETFEPYAKPKVKVGFEYEDKSTNDATAGFDLLGKDGKSLLDPEGDFDGDGYTNKEEIEKGTNPADETSKPSEGDEVKDTTPPTVDAIKPGDKTVSGTGDRPNEEIIVELPGGKKVETTTDENGKWTIEVPADVELKPGDKVIVSDGAGNETTAQVGIDTGKCVATSLGFGLPLLALIPLGLATQMEIPGLTNVVADANAQLQAANTRIQQQLGLFNPEIAAQVDAANKQLAAFGTDLGTVAAGLALIAAGILAGTLIYDNCSPNGGGSSVKDLELKGSSGKTYAGSSKKDEKGGKASDSESGSSKKDNKADKKDVDKADEKAADKK